MNLKRPHSIACSRLVVINRNSPLRFLSRPITEARVLYPNQSPGYSMDEKSHPLNLTYVRLQKNLLVITHHVRHRCFSIEWAQSQAVKSEAEPCQAKFKPAQLIQ